MARRSCAGARGTCLLNPGAVGGELSSARFPSRMALEQYLLLCMWVLSDFNRFCEAQADLLLLFERILRMWFEDLLVFPWVSKGTISKPLQIAS